MNELIFQDDKMGVSQLRGLRVCLAGSFSKPITILKKQLLTLGVSKVDVVSQRSKDEMNSFPTKESTNLFVVGQEVPQGCLARYEMNRHDGFKAVKISENELYALIRGDISIEIPRVMVKHIDIDYNYYCWKAPSNQYMHKSSPFIYDMNSVHSPVYGRELFVPQMAGINYYSLVQIIGNLGGYSNDKNLPNTDMIMLSDETIDNLKNGIKDSVIQKVEDDYNKGTSKIFGCCFTRASDFIKWVDYRLSKCPDESTQRLRDKLFN